MDQAQNTPIEANKQQPNPTTRKKPTHILRVHSEDGSLQRIKCHKTHNLQQLHQTIAGIVELEPGSFVIGLSSKRTDNDFRSNSQLVIGETLPKGTHIWIHELKEAEESESEYYNLLKISRDADPDKIKKAYKQQARKHHPDRPKGDADLFKRIHEAYEVLIDPEKKTIYGKKND